VGVLYFSKFNLGDEVMGEKGSNREKSKKKIRKKAKLTLLEKRKLKKAKKKSK